MLSASLLPTRISRYFPFFKYPSGKGGPCNFSRSAYLHDIAAISKPNDHIIKITRPSSGLMHVPLIIDSPHSGTSLPPWADPSVFTARRDRLTQAEDSFVDELWSGAPVSAGATLVSASFPRWFIDPNRESNDIDPDLMDPGMPLPQGLELAPGAKSKLGIGLIRR